MTLKACALSSNTSYYKKEILEKNKQLHSYSVELKELVLPDTPYINLHGCSLLYIQLGFLFLLPVLAMINIPSIKLCLWHVIAVTSYNHSQC